MIHFIPYTMAFYRKEGTQNVTPIAVKSATVLAKGDLVAIDGNNNQVDAAASNAAILGIALAASASGSTTAIPVDILSPGEWITGDVESGTPASGDFDTCDLNSQDGVTLTSTNEDFVYRFNGSTTTVDLLPKYLEVVQNT